MAGKKRSINGQVKQPAQDIPMTDATPPCAQPPPLSTKTTSTPSTTSQTAHPATRAPSKSTSKPRKKLPKLPSNTTISKRPLLHPSLPTPFASASSPKTLYITARTPYIPTVKRIRKLLSQIALREKQSIAAREKGFGRNGSSSNNGGGGGSGGGAQSYAQANGRLAARDVEREIVGEVAARKGNNGGASAGGVRGGEEVFVKATGRAIPRALEIGLYFQGEEQECRVRIEMGSVTAVDDIEVKDDSGTAAAGTAEGEDEEEEIPETRLRTLSCVTVSIGLK